jgi:type I restriction enzyme S subunit
MRISSIAQIVGGGTPSTTVAEYWNGQIPWVNAGDVSNANGRYIQNTAYRISERGLASCPARIMPKGTTIIIARGATVGRMAQLGMAMSFNQTCYGLLPSNGLDQDYLYYSMLFSINSIKALTYGTIFGTITTGSFEQWKIPFPPFPEQRLIATALSDVDALLAALDDLIAKKRLIKQGAMQELLTGKRRLPGFSGDWKIKKLGEVLTLRYGKSQLGISDDSGEFPIIATSGEVGRTNQYLYDKPSVIIGRKGTIDLGVFQMS